MAKKRFIAIALTGILSLGTISSLVATKDQENIVKAGYYIYYPEKGDPVYSDHEKLLAKYKHLSNSMDNNYWGIKNQATWEGYIKECKDLEAKIRETMRANKMTEDDFLIETMEPIKQAEDKIKWIAKLNQIEKSYEINYHGIKNAAQWRVYLDAVKTDTERVSSTIGWISILLEINEDEYDSVPASRLRELIGKYGIRTDKHLDMEIRYKEMDAKIKAIEDAHYAELAKVQAKFDAAKASQSLADAQAALEDANKLGTHESTEKLKNEIIALINSLK